MRLRANTVFSICIKALGPARGGRLVPHALHWEGQLRCAKSERLVFSPRCGTAKDVLAAKSPLRARAARISNLQNGLEADRECNAASCDILSCQRRVVDVGGRGGSEDPSWKHRTYLPSARFAHAKRRLSLCRVGAFPSGSPQSASRTILRGDSAARQTRVKPPARTTSEIRLPRPERPVRAPSPVPATSARRSSWRRSSRSGRPGSCFLPASRRPEVPPPSMSRRASAPCGYKQHLDLQLGIDRRTTGMALETGKMGADAAQIDKPINGPKQM